MQVMVAVMVMVVMEKDEMVRQEESCDYFPALDRHHNHTLTSIAPLLIPSSSIPYLLTLPHLLILSAPQLRSQNIYNHHLLQSVHPSITSCPSVSPAT